MERIVGISEAAQALGVAISTLRRWEASGKMVAEHTVGGHRRYDLAKLRPELLRAAEAAVASLQTIEEEFMGSHELSSEDQGCLDRYCTRRDRKNLLISLSNITQ